MVLDMTIGEIRSGKSIPWNADSVMKMIDREAESAGFDAQSIKDMRSPEQIVADAMMRLADSPADVWELHDLEIEAIEKAMDKADQGCMKFIQDKLSAAPPKVWRSRMERVRRLRERTKTRCSRPQVHHLMKSRVIVRHDDEQNMRAALEAAWPLRVMIYTGRSNMPHLANGDPADSVYMVGSHHCKMACDVWQAKFGVRYGPPHDRSSSVACLNRGEIAYKGCIVVMAPGHGKSDFGRYAMACEYIENPYAQILMGHSRGDEAEKNLSYVATLFMPTDPAGRRCISLFGLKIAGNKPSAKRFRLDLPSKTRQHSATASGIKSKISGSNASVIWADDPVDQKEAEQETERDRTFQLLNGTWLSRIRGNKGTFVLITATLWHKADAVNRLIELARDGKAMLKVSIQRCGGPKTSPAFSPLWIEVYPARELRSRYETMRNPALYAAAYMANPVAEERRIVRKLRLYDASSSEHVQFMESSTKYMSLDPSATRGEKADLAGVVYAGLGSVHSTKVVNEHPVHTTEQRLRLITAESIPATQADLVEHVVNLSKILSVDYVLVETRSGFHGTADMFEHYHGIDVIRLDPKNRNKEERLRAAAPAMENANSDLGVWAVVEFPGIKNSDGYLILDPRFKQLAEEILDFGVCATDHSLDALVQMVIHLMPDLGVGTGGIVSKIAVSNSRTDVDPRLVQLLDKFEKKKDNGRIEKDENEWLVGEGGSWKMPRVSSGPGEW